MFFSRRLCPGRIRGSKFKGPDLSAWLAAGVIGLGLIFSSQAAQAAVRPEWVDFPSTPASELVATGEQDLGLDFCSKWNPEFGLRTYFCCSAVRPGRKERRKCSAHRIKKSYCDEMTEEQIQYSNEVASGWVDPLADFESRWAREQAFCSVNDGFLAHGRRLVATSQNFLLVQSANRCLDFGTDPMVAMLEWTGRQIGLNYGSEYPDLRLFVGDMAAPRGGCFGGRSGRRAHSSHTNGLDVDLGFFNPRKGEKTRLGPFDRSFNAPANWWLIKQLFKNPYACVRGIFLDRSLIRKLMKTALGDPDWQVMGRFIRHVKGHRNHLHVRVGPAPGAPGCEGVAGVPSEVDPEEYPEEYPEENLKENLKDTSGESPGEREAESPIPGQDPQVFIKPTFQTPRSTASVLESERSKVEN